MQMLLVLVMLSWLISLPWASIMLWLIGPLIVGVSLCGIAMRIIKSLGPAMKGHRAIDIEYVRALENLVAEADTENRKLRTLIIELRNMPPPSKASSSAAAALHARVGLSETAPAWLVTSARRAYRSKLHPDRHPPHRKDEAERRYKQAEQVFDEIAALRG